MRYFISLIAGLLVGSFSNVCLVRLPMEESLWLPRSHCTHCQRQLKNVHNIPLLSFLALHGRCSFCKSPISWQYPLIEALLAAFFLLHAWIFSGAWAQMLVADVLTFYLITISVIDYRHRIIPDELSLSLLTMGLLISPINPYLFGPIWLKIAHSLIACFGGGSLTLLLAYLGEKTFRKEALGGGDVKLIAASGAILGWGGIIGPMLLGSVSGGLVAFFLLISKKKKFGETLPFGPFLSFGIYVTCLFPRWWLNLIRP